MVSEESIFQHQRRVVLKKLQKGLVKMMVYVLFNHFVMVKGVMLICLLLLNILSDCWVILEVYLVYFLFFFTVIC